MAKQDFVKYHLREVLRGAAAEANGGLGFVAASAYRDGVTTVKSVRRGVVGTRHK